MNSQAISTAISVWQKCFDCKRKKKNITKLVFMSKASHNPTLNIHVEACSTSEMGYSKRLSHVREQEEHEAHFYGIHMYWISLD